jgi:hypothetical protein
MMSLVLGAIATVLGSGLTSILLTHWLSSTRAEKDFKRQKLEELFLELQSFHTFVKVISIPFKAAMQGRIKLSEAQERVLKIEANTTSYPKIKMIVQLYFPQLLKSFADFLTKKDEHGFLIGAFRENYAMGKDTSHFVEKLVKAQNDLDKSYDDLLADVAQVAERL